MLTCFLLTVAGGRSLVLQRHSSLSCLLGAYSVGSRHTWTQPLFRGTRTKTRTQQRNTVKIPLYCASKEASTVKKDEKQASVDADQLQISVDQSSSSKATAFNIKVKRAANWLPDVVLLCCEGKLVLESLVLRTEGDLTTCQMHISNNGSKVTEQHMETLKEKIRNLFTSPNVQDASLQQLPKDMKVKEEISSSPELPYVDFRDRFVNYEQGFAFYADNHASANYTTLTAIVPNEKTFLPKFMKQLKEMSFHIPFASLSTYNKEGKVRHDVYHVTNWHGEQLDAVQCDSLVGAISELFDTVKNNSDGHV